LNVGFRTVLSGLSDLRNIYVEPTLYPIDGA